MIQEDVADVRTWIDRHGFTPGIKRKIRTLCDAVERSHDVPTVPPPHTEPDPAPADDGPGFAEFTASEQADIDARSTTPAEDGLVGKLLCLCDNKTLGRCASPSCVPCRAAAEIERETRERDELRRAVREQQWRMEPDTPSRATISMDDLVRLRALAGGSDE